MIYIKHLTMLVFFVLTTQKSFSQSPTFFNPLIGALHMLHNFDLVHTDKKLATISAYSALRVAANKGAKDKLENMVEKQTQYLIDRYKKNDYDGKNSFISANTSTIAMTAGSQMAASTFSNSGYYMTKNKREYMQNFNTDKTILAFLQVLDYDNINSGQRQEIYRLRRELTKQYSYNDKAVMGLFGLPAIQYAMANDAALLQLINGLSLLE